MYNGVQTYRRMDVMTTDPRRLILMLYEGALKHLSQAREAMMRGDVQEKCEQLSKAIAIVEELLASVRVDDSDEASLFLRGLYTAILAELPRANLEDDAATLDRASKYLSRLKEIWEDCVMSGPAAPGEAHTAGEDAGPGRTAASGASAVVGGYPFQSPSARLHANPSASVVDGKV